MSERRRRAEEVRGLADWFRNSGHPTEEAILRAAADLLDPPFAGPTVRVRIAIGFMRHTLVPDFWVASGGHGFKDFQSIGMVSAVIGKENVGVVRFVEADVPLPAQSVVEGEAVS